MARDHCSDCRRVDHIYAACCSIFLSPGRMPTPRAGRRGDRAGNAKAALIVAAAKAATIVAAAKAATIVAAAKAAAKAAVAAAKAAPPASSGSGLPVPPKALPRGKGSVGTFLSQAPPKGVPVPKAGPVPSQAGPPLVPAGKPWSASATFYIDGARRTTTANNGIPPASSVPSQAGPAPSQAGPVPSQAGPAPSQAGPAPSQAGPAPSQAGPVPSQAGPAHGFVMAPGVLRDRSSSIELQDDSSCSSSGRGSQWSNLSTAFATHDQERAAAQSPRGRRWRGLGDNYDGSTEVYSSDSPDVEVYASDSPEEPPTLSHPEGLPQVFRPEGPPLAATAAAPPAATAAAPPATKGPPPAAKAPPPADGPRRTDLGGRTSAEVLVGPFRPDLGGHVIDVGNHVTLGALLPPLASPFAIVRRKRWREAQTAKVIPRPPGQSNLMMALAPPPPPPPPPPYKAGT